MATVFHQIQYWTLTIPPGQAVWLSYGPDDRYSNGTVQVMCSPSSQVGSQVLQQTISVPEVFNTVVPQLDGDITINSYYAGFNIFNRGQNTIQNFSVAITIIGP
jgi:hypothetical protein